MQHNTLIASLTKFGVSQTDRTLLIVQIVASEQRDGQHIYMAQQEHRQTIAVLHIGHRCPPPCARTGTPLTSVSTEGCIITLLTATKQEKMAVRTGYEA